jgi:4,5-dihydroxyphthalate decarboxylase
MTSRESPTPNAPDAKRLASAETIVRGGDYEHVLGFSGDYAGGIRLRYEPMSTREIFERMLAERSYEVCEFSLANYLTLRASGEDWLSALPIFPYRAFRHGFAVTRIDSPLTDLAQLAGKRVGVPDYSMTAAVYMRGLLADEYGVTEGSITWVSRERQRLPIPPQAKVELTADNLEDLLLQGRIDALLEMSLRDSSQPPQLRRLRPVLADVEAAERDYFVRSGIFPIMHCVVIRSDVARAMPALASAVWQAYTDCKARAYRRRLGTTLAPWSAGHWAKTFALFEGDPLPYGLTAANCRVIERFGTYLRNQGLIRTLPPMNALFSPVESRQP